MVYLILIVITIGVILYIKHKKGVIPVPVSPVVGTGTLYSITIDQIDLDNANGNNPPNNGSVVFEYVDINGNTTKRLFNNAGQTNDTCVKVGTDPVIYYFTNNIQRAAVSTYSNLSTVCG